MSKERKKQRYRSRKKKGSGIPMLLTAKNYKLLVYGVLAAIIGFGGMYIEGQQFGIFSLYIAPLLVLGGFATIAVSVFRTDPELEAGDRSQQSSSQKTSGSPSS